jgi:hypothetical protein
MKKHPPVDSTGSECKGVVFRFLKSREVAEFMLTRKITPFTTSTSLVCAWEAYQEAPLFRSIFAAIATILAPED